MTKTEYAPTKMNISKAQADAILTHMKEKKGMTMRLGSGILHDTGNVILPLTMAQNTKLQKNRNKEVGTDLKLSKTQLRKIRSGGYLPALMMANIPTGTGDYNDTFNATLGENNPKVMTVAGEGIVGGAVRTVGKVAKAVARPIAKVAIRGACDLAETLP